MFLLFIQYKEILQMFLSVTGIFYLETSQNYLVKTSHIWYPHSLKGGGGLASETWVALGPQFFFIQMGNKPEKEGLM